MLGHFNDLQNCFPVIFPFLGNRVSILRGVYISSVVSERNTTSIPLCTRAEDQSSWAGSPSINYAANCLTGCSFIQHHSTNISSSCWWWSWSFSRALWGRLALTSSVTHSRFLYLFVIWGALFFSDKPDYFIILQNSLKFLLIRLSLFPRTAKDLISLLCSFCHFSGIWGENVAVYICHVDWCRSHVSL